MRHRSLLVSLVLALALSAGAQTEVIHRDDFQSYKTPSNPPGWVDTSVGTPKPEASGLYKAWPDPLQPANVVYGTKQSSGKPEGDNPRIGTFSTLTTKRFDAKGRFEYSGRLLRTHPDSRIGLTFLSSYPETDKYYLIGLWSQTMQLFAFGAGAPQGTLDSNVAIDPNKWYRFLIQVDNVSSETRIRARFWPDGTPEPTTWSIDAVDAAPARLTTGRIGMWAAVKGDAYIDDVFAKSPVDHTPPVIAFADADTQRVLDPAQLALFKTPARIEIRVTDDLSTFTTTTKLDGAPYTSATPITADGIHKITVTAVDAPGNTATATLDLLVDQVPPVLTLLIDGAPFAQGAIFDKDVTLSAQIQDISTVTSVATLNGATVTLPQPIAEERVHAISVTATDQVGRQTTVASSFVVDKTAPVVTILANGVELGGGESFQTDVTLTWSATDLTFDRIEATLNGAPIASGTTVTAERIHDLAVKAYDKAGHATTETRKFVLDKTAPEVRLLANGETFKPGTTFNAPVTFTAEVNDTTPTTEAATLDNATYTLGSAFGAEGPHTIKVVVTNAAGLATTVGPSPFTIDLTPPTIMLTESGEPFRDALKFNRDVRPVVTATDNLTQSSLRELFLNGREFPLDTPIAEESAEHVLTAKATDDGGNATSVGPFRFMLDKTKPVVAIVEETTGKPFAAGALFARPVRVKITVTDLTRTTLAATLNGAPFDPATSITQDGTYTISVTATDEAGWQNDPVTAAFTIDQTPPSLTFTSHADGAVVSTPNVILGGGSDDAVAISIAGAQATIDPAAKTFLSEPVALVEGTNTITASAIDKAGNTGTARLRLELDTRAPQIDVTAPLAGACVDATALTVTGTVADPRVDSVKVNGVAATIANGEWTASLSLDEGPQLLTIVAADALGHQTTITRAVLIDRTAPEVEVRESGVPLTATLFARSVTPLLRAIDADPNAQLTATLAGAPYASGTPVDAEGAHALEVIAIDCAGHRTARSVAFTIDRTAPALGSLDPANGATVGTLPTRITGTAGDAALIELLGTGITAAPAPGGAFALDGVRFAEGVNAFVLRATDGAGNASQTDYRVTVKTAGPVVTILEGGAPLAPNALFTRAITPEFRVDDPTATLTATLNGAPYTSGTEIAADGDYTLKATATDALSHTGTAEVFFTVDRTAPSVRITFPRSGNVAAEQIEVRGTATSAVAADVNGQPVALDANGNFVLDTLYLEPGTTRIVATARDRAGNTGIDEVEVTRDDIRPGIVLTYPPDRALTNRPATEVLGRILSPNPDGAVTIGTQTAPVDPLGAFRLSGYPLVEGDNTITATTKTNAGGTNSASVVVTADFTPPSLTILESNQPLNDGSRFASEAVLSLQASDSRGGVPVNVTVELLVDGTKVAAMPHTVTATGGHAAVAVARDQAGNETRVERTFFIGATGGGSATCSLSDFDPADGAVVLSSSTTLLGRTTSEGVKANDVAAMVADGSFRATVELPREDANAIALRCTDAAGVAFGDAVTLTLNRVTGDPSIEITAPSEGFVTTGETITVTGTAGPGVVSADVNGAAAAIAGSDPSVARPFTVANVRLAGGLNILVARGRDAAGRVATASRRVTALHDAPSIVISSPLPGAITGAPKIEVAGTYANLDPATIAVTGSSALQTTRLSDTTGTFVASEVPLVAGEQTLRVTGRDPAGRTATASVNVRLVAGAPSIAITSPASNAYFGAGAGGTFTVSGTFSAAEGATVDVGATAAAVQGSTFTATAPFTTIGTATTVVARVTEPGGASAIDSVVVHRLAAAPKVLESFPAPNAVAVDAGAALLVLFSAPMDRASLANGAFRLEDHSGATVGGTLLLDRDVLTFAPAALLTRGARYTLRVTTAAKDLAGNALESEWTAPFTAGTSAPSTPPSLTPVSEAFCGQTVAIRGTAPAGARLQLASGTLTLTATAGPEGSFTFDFPLSGQSGFAVVRVRVVGSDGSLSPAAELSFRVDCAGPQVLNASYDRATNRLTVQFSEPVDVPPGAIYATLSDGRVVGVNGDTPAEDLTARSFTLTVTTAVRDRIGNKLVAPYTQTFTLGTEQPPAGDGSGFISGEIYDATTGRPLANATVTVEIPGPPASSPADAQASRLRTEQRRDAAATAAETAAVRIDTDPRGRYLLRLPEGAHTIRASMPGYTTVWRQIIVPAGAGVIPIDIRLAKRNDTATHGPVTVTAGTVTAVGAQSLAGLLPIGWSPLAAAEVLGDFTTATLTFTVPPNTRPLTAVRYDERRDEWTPIVSGPTSFTITRPGAYALIYPDLIDYDAPATLTARRFTLDPPVVLPNGRTLATLEVDGEFPSGTAVQAYIDEDLRLTDGSRLLDPPFATDLILYRNLDGTFGVADFHLAPSPRAAQVILEVGFDHIRVVPYPGRLDRGTLIGSEGGRVPGDDRVAVDIPAGATPEPLRASAVSLTQQELDAIGPIPGFRVLGGFTLTLQPAVALFKPARATLSTQDSGLGPQLILAELLDGTARLANLVERLENGRATTKTLDRATMPLDGILREGRYLLLAADAPIAFATGVLRLDRGSVLAGARITTNTLGLADLTRVDGIYNIPVPAAPAPPFSLTPREVTTGAGAPYTHPSSPAPDAIVRVDFALVPQPPTLVSVTVTAGNAQVPLGSHVTNVSISTAVRATFAPAIDPASVNATSITVLDAESGIAVDGKSTAEGTLAVNWSLTPGTTLQPGRRYTVIVAPSIRAPGGAQLSTGASYGFTTAESILNAEVRAERISITIPDASGVSRVTGSAGALPANWQALAVRRGRDFVTRYQATAAADGSFTFLIGNGGGDADRVTLSDLIDLRVVNNAGNLAAILPLTPFVTEDRRGFVVPAGAAKRYVTPDNIAVTVAEGTFDTATIVTATLATKQAFDDIPFLDEEVHYATSVRLDFEGRAKKPIELELPIPAGLDTTGRDFLLALKGESTRGPRLFAVDTLRVENGKFTTTRDPSPTAKRIAVQHRRGDVTTTETVTGNDIKDYTVRVGRGGVYVAANIRTPPGTSAGFAAIHGLQSAHELHWSSHRAFYAPRWYMAERGTIVIPVLQGVSFTVVGVDATTGLQAFSKVYDPLPVGDPTVSTLPPPQDNEGGPYPVFATPFRVEQVQLEVADRDIRAIRNFVLRLANGKVSVTASADPLPPATKVEMLNVSNGEYAAGTSGAGLRLNAELGHRIVLIIEEHDVDPNSAITVVFNEPIFIQGTTEDEIHDFLKQYFRLLRAPLPPNASTPPLFADISGQARFTADSGGRRITISQPSSLQRGSLYKVILSQRIADRGGANGGAGLTLGQGTGILNGNVAGVGGGVDVHLDCTVRNPGGTLGTFDLKSGTARDLALIGNILLVAASEGGLHVYDVSDPASLTGTPATIETVPSHGLDFWALAADHHGRIYTTSLGLTHGALRSYRLEDLIDGNGITNVMGGTLTNWRPGYSSTIGGTNALLSDRPESFPRRIQLAVQDRETLYEDRQKFIAGAQATIVTPYSDGMAKMRASFGPAADNQYRVQRVTVENLTLDLRWSADVIDSKSAVIDDIIAGPGDRLRVLRNYTTYGIISHLGYGIGMYDLNAIESNLQPNPPAGTTRLTEQITLTRGRNPLYCLPGAFLPEWAIHDIAVSADSAVRPEPGTTNLLVYAPDPYRGLLDLRFKTNAGATINNDNDCQQRGRYGLVFRAVDPQFDHPRIKALKKAYSDKTKGLEPYPHFLSVANYSWRLEGDANQTGARGSIANQTVQRDYVLVAGGDLGLLVVEVGGDPNPSGIPYFPLVARHLVDIIWVPDGALAVRTIPRTNFAVVLSRYGRVHLIDLAQIDERFGIAEDALFPTAAAAIAAGNTFPEGVGATDLRIIWSSEKNVGQGVLAPVIDTDTGMLFAGQMVSKVMKAIAAIDPRVQMKVDLGQDTLSEVGGVVPHGIEPPEQILDDYFAKLPACNGTTPRCRENASLGAFRLEVSLPGAVAQILRASGSELRVSVESERVAGAVTEQTPPGFPRAHLRRFRRDGSAEDPDRAAPDFRLRRLIPDDPALEKALRHQRGFNKFVSPWIVTLADPRASSRYFWSANTTAQQKADAGCHFCSRPKSLENLGEAQGVYELWTNGRILAVRPEIGANGNDVFAGTPYAYLGERNRLVTRFGTVMADTVRATAVRAAGQNPPVADGAIQDVVYLHSGEMQTAVVDLNAGGRAGFDVVFDRAHRSRTIGSTILGQGWESSNFRRLRPLPNGDVELRDSSGEIWLFTVDPSTGEYQSPKGFFMRLSRIDRGWQLLDQKWRATAFDDLGRLMYESDEFAEDIAVAAGTSKGNVVRYLYDHTGRLARIVDPVQRVSELTYWEDGDAGKPGAYPGLLREAKDWRGRSVLYEYDSLGRLVTVRGPEVQAGAGVPADFTFINTNRPHTVYGYGAVSPLRPSSPPTPSQAFNDYLELAGNLKTVTEPDQTRTTNGVARVTLTYDDTTGHPRDRLLTQTWGTGETVTFIHTNATEVASVDAYGQRREYQLTPATAHDKRVHVAEGRIVGVAVIETTAIKDPADPGLQHSSADITAKFTYNDEGLHESIEYANGLKVANRWKYASDPGTANRDKSLAPGMVLEHATTSGPHLPAPIETDLRYDKEPNHDAARATLVSVGRGTGTDVQYRDAQSPSRGRKEVSSEEEGFVSVTEYDDFGLPISAGKKQGNVTRIITKTEYHDADAATPPVSRSRPKIIESGTLGTKQSFTYAEIPGGGEKIEIRDGVRQVVTEILLDAHGRKTNVLVKGAGNTVLSKESFGYDAAGRLACFTRQQTGAGSGIVETRYHYDAMGREVSRSTTGAMVHGSLATLTQTTAHDFARRTITETGPYAGSPGGAPTTITTVDGLGRPRLIERKGAGGEIVRTISGFDRSGAASYQSDGVRNATLTLNDARGRQVDAITADGIRTQTTWGPWDEPVDITERGSDGKIIGQTKHFFTGFGRLRATNEAVDATGRARSTYLTWDAADTELGTRIGLVASLTTAAPAGRVRVQQQSFDFTGRITRTIFGEAVGPDSVPSGTDILNETTYVYDGSVPSRITSSEPRVTGASTTTTTTFDALERPVATSVDGSPDPTLTTYDEAGNVLSVDAQGMDPSSATYDSRGLMTSSTHPGGGTIQLTYDALGSRRTYKDENGIATTFTTDGLGRVTRVDYPDRTSEETRYEANTGMVLATRDRAGQWLAFSYGAGGRLLSVHIGEDTAKPKLTAFEYDAGGRVTMVRNKDAAVVYEAYDLLGRPTITRTIRYENASGFSDPPLILDVHSQKHVWSVFDGERDFWRMPAAGVDFLDDNAASPWLQTIAEVYDAGSNLLKQRSGTRDLTSGVGRAAGKLQSRERAIGSATPPAAWLKTGYAYTGDPGTTGAKSFLIAKAESSIGGTNIGGSENARDAADRIASTKDLGLGDRVSRWLYDARGRLERSWLNVESARPRAPTVDAITASDFRASRTTPALLTPQQHQSLGANAAQVEPLSWTATQNDARQFLERDSTLDGQVQDARVYTFTGGRRTKDGAWTSEFDELGRLTAITNATTARRIEYDWGPNDRIVGRTALRPVLGGGYGPEDRAAVLQADGLPARTTFVWDPITDRLLAIYEEGRSLGTTDPEAGLLRQYLHGDRGADDPVRILAADENGVVRTYLPLLDEAGTGSLQSVVDAATGNVVERVLYADSYGDGPRYLQGPVVDSIDLDAKKSPDGQIERVTVRVHLTEAIDAASLPDGVRLGAISDAKLMVRPTLAVPKVEGRYSVVWEIGAHEWTSMAGAGVALEVAVRDTLRATRWGDTPVTNAPAWAAQVYGVLAEPDAPVIARQSFASLDAFLATIKAGESKTTNVYGMTDLYLAASRESRTRLFTGFKAAPFIEPATSLVYLRARWYDPATGAFLTPDPAGYADSSNLYAGFAHDPVNNSDPSGELVESVWDAASLGMGLYSISQWDENTSFWEMTLDVVGVGLDAAALALPFVPGGAGAAIKAGRGADTAYDAISAGRKAKKVIDVAQTLEQTMSATLAGVRLYDDYVHGNLGLHSAFDVVQVGLGLRKAAKAALPKRAPPAAAALDAGPCPLRLMPACVAAGTPISTPDGEAVAIEDLRVGDRVASTHVTDIPEGALTFDAREWHLVRLRMANPKDAGDTYDIETLRPLAWIVAHEAFPGRTITFATERNPEDQGYVVALERMPAIAPGPGRVVLSTFTHRDQILRLRFEGESAPLDTTPSHRIFSVEKDTWVPASELKAGDPVRTRDGKVTIASIERTEVARVFDIEVESDHSYFVEGADVLAHNCGTLDRNDTRLAKNINKKQHHIPHHLIGVAQAKRFTVMHYAAKHLDYDINRGSNGIGLPTHKQTAVKEKLPYHKGKHTWDLYVGPIEAELEALQAYFDLQPWIRGTRRVSQNAETYILQEIGRIEQFARDGLLDGSLRLNAKYEVIGGHGGTIRIIPPPRKKRR